MLLSEINGFMPQVLKHTTVLVVLSVILKQFCDFCPHFVVGYKSIWKITEDELRIQEECPIPAVLCLCVSFLSLLLLPDISHPHTPTLKCMNLPQLGLQQELLQNSGSWQCLCFYIQNIFLNYSKRECVQIYFQHRGHCKKLHPYVLCIKSTVSF